MKETLLQRTCDALRESVPLDVSNIRVSAKDSIITLSGSVESPDEKEIAVAIVKSVPGVKAIIQKLKVEISPEKAKANSIAEEVRSALKESMEIPRGHVRVRTHPDRLVLEGSVKWNYQKAAALEIAGRYASAIAISDTILVDPQLKDELTRESILDMFRSDGRVVCDDINVIVNGKNVIIVGSVPTPEQKALLLKISEAIPGVGAVNNAVHVR